MPDLFCIYHKKTKKFLYVWAEDAEHAVEIAGWKAADVEIHVRTAKSGWANVGIAPRAIRRALSDKDTGGKVTWCMN